jgi:hypothetical protein
MCLQCECEAEVFGTLEEQDFLPGYRLQRATKSYFDEWQAGQWGVIQMNDPDFYWTGELIEYDPSKEDDSEKSYDDENKFLAEARKLEEAILSQSSLNKIMNLYEVAKGAGYQHSTQPTQLEFSCWLLNRLATWVKTHPAKSIDEWEALERGISMEEWMKFKNEVEHPEKSGS